MTLTEYQQRAAEHDRIMAERRATTPAPGWQVGGARYGHAIFPQPPDDDLLAGLLDERQTEALEHYRKRLDDLATARAVVREAQAAVDGADGEDAAGAAEAAAAGAGVAPPSVKPAREDALARARRYERAVIDLAADALRALWSAVVPDQERLVVVANAALYEDDGRRLDVTCRREQAVRWALHVEAFLVAPDPHPAFTRQPDPAIADREAVLNDRAADVARFTAQREDDE